MDVVLTPKNTTRKKIESTAGRSLQGADRVKLTMKLLPERMRTTMRWGTAMSSIDREEQNEKGKNQEREFIFERHSDKRKAYSGLEDVFKGAWRHEQCGKGKRERENLRKRETTRGRRVETKQQKK
jgi:hypothetical protein